MTMQYFVWLNEYVLGLPGVDEQHQKLFTLGRELHSAYLAGEAGAERVAEVIGQLAFHFRTEEEMMLAAGYDGYAAHKSEHDWLLASLQGVQDISDRTFADLNDWVTNHIAGADRRMAAALTSPR